MTRAIIQIGHAHKVNLTLTQSAAPAILVFQCLDAGLTLAFQTANVVLPDKRSRIKGVVLGSV